MVNTGLEREGGAVVHSIEPLKRNACWQQIFIKISVSQELV